MERGLPEHEADALRAWMRDGYAILPGAVPHDVVDRINADVDAIWDGSDRDAAVEIDGERALPTPELRDRKTKLLDLYVSSEATREAAFADGIVRFLRQIFEGDPLLFQSLSLERGSEQPLHQDTAYVVVSPPLEFAAAWIALEDVQPSSGELVYHPGSHRISEFFFRGGYRNWNRARDGIEARDRYEEHLCAEVEQIAPSRFLPRKGDVLFWNADLLHGGSPEPDPRLTRKSLVCHYCAPSAKPYYFNYLPNRRARRTVAGRGEFASSHHAI